MNRRVAFAYAIAGLAVSGTRSAALSISASLDGPTEPPPPGAPSTC
jgi:hypothetical protein